MRLLADISADCTNTVKPGEDKNETWKIALPRQLLKAAVKLFHLVDGH